MKRTKILIILIFAILIQTMTVLAANADENPAKFKTTEEEIIKLLNNERVKGGMSELEQDDNLSNIARKKAEEMAEKQSETLEFKEGIKKFLKNNGAEAKAHTYYFTRGKKTAAEIVKIWIKNINFDRDTWAKEKTTHIGVGAAKAADGTMFFVCINTKPFGDKEKSELEDEVIRLVNAERKKQGLTSLTKNEDLMKIARLKADDMSENGYCDHESPTYGSPKSMVHKYVKNVTYSGEIIAAGQQTANDVFTAWKNSPAHNKIMLKESANFIGVGVALDSKGNLIWSLMLAKK